MYQDLTIVIASVVLAVVVGIGVIIVIKMPSLIRASNAAKKSAANEATSRVTRERLEGSRAAAEAPVGMPKSIKGAAPADAPGPVSVDQPEIGFIGGQPIEWGQSTSPPQLRVPFDPPDPRRSAPAGPRLVRNAGVALLAVALVGVAAIATSPNLGAATPSGGVLGATEVSAPGTQRSEVPGAPAAVVAALRGTAVVNDRLAVDADDLQTELARKRVRAVDLARQLRSLVSDTELGVSLANRLEAWPDADPLRSDLTSFYQAVAETARDGRRAQLSDLTAYRSAASSTLTLVAELRASESTVGMRSRGTKARTAGS
ncbi:MAG: hypothetical protein H0T59_05595 [Chloroflexi bacterium]|nr:hypothetical protein [Chloroflexota bacterium]